MEDNFEAEISIRSKKTKKMFSHFENEFDEEISTYSNDRIPSVCDEIFLHFECDEKSHRDRDLTWKRSSIISCDECLQLKTSNDFERSFSQDPLRLILSPICKTKHGFIFTQLIRDRSKSSSAFRFQIDLDNGKRSMDLLTAEKQWKLFGQASFQISFNSKLIKDHFRAELVYTNLLSTSYALKMFNGNEETVLAFIRYESNFLGFQGPRRFRVVLPELNKSDKGLSIAMPSNPSLFSNENDRLIRLHSEISWCNEMKDEYCWNFSQNHSRIASVKNFQLVYEDRSETEPIVMDYGKMSEDVFACDLRCPLSLIQAFGIGISALDSQFFRE